MRSIVSCFDIIIIIIIVSQTRKAIKVNGRPGKVETQDIVFLIRRDAKKVSPPTNISSSPHFTHFFLAHRLIVCAS
jgi:hypothetical protein